MLNSKNRVIRIAAVLLLGSFTLNSTAYARGFGGGGGGGGHWGGGGGGGHWGGGGGGFEHGGGGFEHGGGGFDHGGGGFDHSGGGFDHGGGGFDHGGGGFDHGGGDWNHGGGDWNHGGGDWNHGSGDWNHGGGYDHGGDWGNRSNGNHPLNPNMNPNHPNWGDHGIATDGGFGHIANNDHNFNNYGHIGNNTFNVNRNTMVNNGNIVRGNYGHYGAFDGGWYGAHPGCWGGGWGGGYCYNPTPWLVMGPFLGMTTGMMMGMGMGAMAGGRGCGGGSSTTIINNTTPSGSYAGSYAAAAPPVEYDYGNNIIYEGDNVYYGGQPVCSATDYYNQASNLASAAPQVGTATPVEADWKPFGVFSLVEQGQSNSTTLFQLSVNKEGTIRGNYYNTLTDETKQVSGSIDKKTARACWKVEGVPNVVYDTGVGNLMESQAPILVHFNQGKTQQMLLVRIPPQNQQQMPTTTTKTS